ncbi:invasion associated locus B family protein [uncultured Roseobacter sp.]|uniref:invasion associated locus B family protein n=1 Tax=uncultured Roseobacter sp. TaxID=114847 RepID=UPI002610BE4B|nr:invasion associated locus B family protein [uncultured Roseobacter sp.]
MPDFSKSLTRAALAVAPLVLVAGLAAAQTTSEETTDPAETADEGLSLGTEADAGPKVGEAYTAEQNGDWTLRCIKTEDGNDPCQMVQLLSDEEGSPIAEFSLFRLPEGGAAEAGATVIVPLETSLQEQLSIQVDLQTGKAYPFAFCNPVGCYARIGLTSEDVANYKRGNEAAISIVPVAAPDQVVTVRLSLTGFTASYDKTTVAER